MSVFNFDLGLAQFGKNLGDSVIKIEQDFQSLLTVTVQTITEWFDDFWYNLSELFIKIINVLEIFIICFFTWLALYSIIYPQDLWQKGMDIANLGTNIIGGTLNRGSKLLI